MQTDTRQSYRSYVDEIVLIARNFVGVSLGNSKFCFIVTLITKLSSTYVSLSSGSLGDVITYRPVTKESFVKTKYFSLGNILNMIT